MNERIKKLFKPAIIIAAVTFAICYLIKKPQEFGDYTSYVGYAVTAVTIFFYIYEKWMWRIIPWNRPPVLKKKYTGIIHYNFSGTAEKSPCVFRLNNLGLVLIFRWRQISIQVSR